MPGEYRPAEILVALRRIGYLDKPSVGDHVDLYFLLTDHPAGGSVTMHTGLDMGHCSKRDVARIKRETHISGAMWERLLKKKLRREEYEAHLRASSKADLVNPFWRHLFE